MAGSTEARALRGDDAAWNALVQAHDHRVVVALVARGARPCEARECAQEAWMRLVQQQREGRLAELQLPGLAIRQARFIWLERCRRAGTVVPLDGLREPADGAGSEDRMLDRARLGRTLRALDRESDRDRALFEAAYGGEGPSHADLADRFGLSLQRTRQILSEVRQRLKAALGDG
ncbi:MAG: sigma-70 family RNA polymerase sigma factor [Alphaproteobacteria bacterium]|nr:sigma-70 family RNA polymerase sigma factor [Alphaproteobacteria bacterium]